MIWEVITENAYPSRLIGFSIGPESLLIFCLGWGFRENYLYAKTFIIVYK